MDKDTSINDGFKNFKLFVFDATLSTEPDDVNALFIDSSASFHMSCHKDWFDEYQENIDGTCGQRVIGVMLPNGIERQIHDGMYVPHMKKNLISISIIANQDLNVEFVKSQCVVKNI